MGWNCGALEPGGLGERWGGGSGRGEEGYVEGEGEEETEGNVGWHESGGEEEGVESERRCKPG